jgi:hypothetical protein
MDVGRTRGLVDPSSAARRRDLAGFRENADTRLPGGVPAPVYALRPGEPFDALVGRLLAGEAAEVAASKDEAGFRAVLSGMREAMTMAADGGPGPTRYEAAVSDGLVVARVVCEDRGGVLAFRKAPGAGSERV